jgi:hypothetical protein
MTDPPKSFEEAPYAEPPDETSVSLRAYFDRMSDERLRDYEPAWSDHQVMEWDGNFRSDGALMLVCCDRDVGIAEYRLVLAECLRFRGLDQAPGS